MSKFGERLAELRKEKGFSQRELSKHIKITQATIARWEAKTQEPLADNIIEVAKYFEVSTDYILGVKDY